VEVIAGFEDTGFVLACLEVAEVGLYEGVLASVCFGDRWMVKQVSERTTSRGLTMSYQPGICMPKFCEESASCLRDLGKKVKHTTVIGMAGAFGKINLTSSNFALRRQFSANVTHPAPLSPRPCAMITVAVCFLTAGTMRADG
jgi:hypothetical protein